MILGKLKKLIEKGETGYFINWDEVVQIPEFQTLMDCKQNPKWHSEGTVWIHTGIVCQEAIKTVVAKNYKEEDAYVLLASALFHDIGKGTTTKLNKRGDWSSPGHDEEGEKITRRILWDTDIVIRERICRLVKCHMQPLCVWEHSDPLKHILDVLNTGVEVELLADLKRCDQNGSSPYSGYDIQEDLRKIDAFEKWAKLMIPISDGIAENGGKLYSPETGIFDRDVVVMIGLPGSGKNTYIDKNLNDPIYEQISRDDIRTELGYCKPGEKYLGTTEEENKVTKVFYDKFKNSLDFARIPVLNNTNLKKKYRDEYVKFAEDLYRIHWHYVYVQAETIAENKERRTGQIPDKVFYDMMGKIEMPTYTECGDFKIFISRDDRFDEIKLNR